jgi:sugar lactone lactonase YvrE
MFRVVSLIAAVALVLPATAQAGWSAPATFPAIRARDGASQLAINARGDALVVWTSRTPARLRATLSRADGTRVTHTLPAQPKARDLVVVLDARGIATAAWTAAGRLYAASAASTGRWSQRQLVARRHAAIPTLAVARDRRVLLVWTVDTPTGVGGRTGIAWRSPGQRFAHAQLVRHPAPRLMPGESPQSVNGAAFDARGRAYVWTSCDGAVGITRPRARKLRLARVTSGPATLSLAVNRSGRGIATWVPTRCTGDPAAGTPPGILRASALRGGAFGSPVVLTGPAGQPLMTSGSTAFSPVGTGSLVALWSGADLLQVALDRAGRQLAVARIGAASMPLATDAAGNLLVSAPYVGVTVRRRDGTEDPFVPGSIGAQWAATPDAAGFGVVFDPDLTTLPDHHVTSPANRLSLSFWRP